MQRALIVAFAMATAGCASAPCALPAATELWSEGPAHEAGGKRVARFDLDDEPRWWSATMPRSTRLTDFRAAVRARVPDVSPTALIDEVLRHAPDAATRLPLEVARAAATAITPMRCLEAALFDDQAARLDMATSPSEVLAFILARNGKLRVYTYTVNAAGIGGVGHVRPYVEAEVAAGWRLAVVFHNHNFFLDRQALTPGQVDLGVGGVVAPSAPDVQLLRGMRDELGMGAAWISNGFHTGHWSGDALDRMAAPEP